LTQRSYLKCDVCGSITLIRLQAGWLDWHPIIIPCGHCGILISGKATFRPPHVDCEFHNASEVGEQQADFYLEISGELPAKLLRPMGVEQYVWSPPPFFQAIEGMGHENYEKFKSRFVAFLENIEKRWPEVRRINELWNSGERMYLAKEVHTMLPRKQWPMTNEAEMLRGVHMVKLRFFDPVLSSDYFATASKDLMPKIGGLAKKHPAAFLDLLTYFSPDNLLKHYEQISFNRLQAFVELFRSLIPAFAQFFYKNGVPNDVGITTVDFDALKHFYADSYESLSELLPLVIAYNNLSERGDFRAMKSLRKDVTTLDHLLEKSKGERLRFLDGSDPFGGAIATDLDNKLRNAIAHNSYSYDRKKQRITYFSSGKIGQGDALDQTLLDFAASCWNLHDRMMEIVELLYQTRKNGFVLLHGHPIVSSSVFTREAIRPSEKKVRPRRQPHNRR
jgi:hypothetical protein